MMLEFNDVTKRFGDIEAVSEVSFYVEPGELVFITGPSGAGKTTLLRLLIREFLPTSGKIIFDGREVQKLKRRDVPKLRQSIGSVLQDYKLLGERTIGENAEVALAVCGVAKKDWEERVDQVMSLVGLSERSDLFPSQLSGGELQRAAIARALILNPSLIFADEPTGNLDDKTAEGIMDLFSKIKQEGKTVLISTHNKGIMDKHRGRILRFEAGKLVEDSDPKQRPQSEDDEVESDNGKKKKKKK